MSLLDEVRKLEKQVIARLRELEPLVREHEQLRAVAERLGLKYSPSPSETGEGAAADTKASEPTAAAKPAKRRAAKPAAKRGASKGAAKQRAARPAADAGAGRRAAKRAAKPRAGRAGADGRAGAARPGQRQDDVLRLVGEQPGITVREIGAQLGVDATGLYRVANRLAAEGRVRKDGPRLHPGEPEARATASAGAGAGSAQPAAPTPPPGDPDAGTES